MTEQTTGQCKTCGRTRYFGPNTKHVCAEDDVASFQHDQRRAVEEADASSKSDSKSKRGRK